MSMIIQVKIAPHLAEDRAAIDKAVRRKASGTPYKSYKIKRKSIDARSRKPFVVFAIELDPVEENSPPLSFPNASKGEEVHIIGTGPAGYFAALKCIKNGLRPILFERGKDAQTRRRDLRALQQFGIVNSNSNYCFGEGGAGTYSDGKLYTRSAKRGNIQSILETFVYHGATTDILIDAHPHIGSNKLPQVVQNIRATILEAGGEIHFNTTVTDIIAHNNQVVALQLNGQNEIKVKHVILATGHSARDIFNLFERKKWTLEYKPFAMGVRIEHSQPLIDKIQYGSEGQTEGLPAASYNLACQADGRGVFSFCMCPGGLVVPASTAPGELVVNGMSLSKRDSPFANAGLVVEVTEEEMERQNFTGSLRGVQLQSKLEREVWSVGDGSQSAPAQRLTDFVSGKDSKCLPDTSYIPGVFSARMDQVLPPWMVKRLKIGLQDFGRKMRGYYTEDAILMGIESRTSSPLRIPREENGLHPDVKGLYPCGEGAGFAGGILSAAMDGERVVDWILASIKG